MKRMLGRQGVLVTLFLLMYLSGASYCYDKKIEVVVQLLNPVMVALGTEVDNIWFLQVSGGVVAPRGHPGKIVVGGGELYRNHVSVPDVPWIGAGGECRLFLPKPGTRFFLFGLVHVGYIWNISGTMSHEDVYDPDESWSSNYSGTGVIIPWEVGIEFLVTTHLSAFLALAGIKEGKIEKVYCTRSTEEIDLGEFASPIGYFQDPFPTVGVKFWW